MFQKLSFLIALICCVLLSSCASQKKYIELEENYNEAKSKLQKVQMEKEQLEEHIVALEEKVADYNSAFYYLKDSEEQVMTAAEAYMKTKSLKKIQEDLLKLEEFEEDYNMNIQYVRDSDPHNEISIRLKDLSQCDIDNRLRNIFPEHQFIYVSGNELWFYDFAERTRSVFGIDFYLLELYTIDFTDKNKIKSTVRYFESVERKPGRIERIEYAGSNNVGLNKIKNLITNCHD